ncbi:MAG: response regulator, partial [Rhodospirillaceae bacterium]|nr:response regulator [Rhodospirillaceae bacterium]
MSAKRKILLIEDDTALRQSLAEQLELYKEFALSEAGTGVEGLEMAQNGQFDIILLDVGLPDMDGREV